MQPDWARQFGDPVDVRRLSLVNTRAIPMEKLLPREWVGQRQDSCQFTGIEALRPLPQGATEGSE